MGNRVLLRRALRERLHLAPAAERERLAHVLRDRRVFEEVHAQVVDVWCDHCDAARGPVQDFFEWLIANWDSILRIIEQVLALFTVAA